MIYPLVSIRDNKVGFTGPSCEVNLQVAVRNFAKAVNTKDSLYGFSAGDFSLYHVADYDPDTGAITPVVPIELVVDASSLKVGDE